MSTEYAAKLDFATHLDFSEILTNPILDIAARFWDDERYAAFRTCYRSMRIIDDLVDNRKATGHTIGREEGDRYAAIMNRWIEGVRGTAPVDGFQEELVATMRRFVLPTWPWEKLLKAMVYDLNHAGFATFVGFLRYCEGAAVAPGAIFMHLCGVSRRDDHYLAPPFDIRRAARALGVFSYLVHVVRDFQKDQLNNLNYFADDLVAANQLSPGDLRAIAEGGEVSPSFRRLIRTYRHCAEYYRRKARRTIDGVLPNLEPRYRLSLEIIYSLYSQIFERIEPDTGSFTTEALNPRPFEVEERIRATMGAFEPAK
jgi:phytoene/squalene synthetase